MRIVTIIAVGMLMLVAGFGTACKEQQSSNFEKNARCLTLAEQYRKDQQDMYGSKGGKDLIVMLSRVDYSAIRDNCIAVLLTENSTPGLVESYEVIELPSARPLRTTICAASKQFICVDPKPRELADEAFSEAMASKDDPISFANMYKTPDTPHDTSLYIKRPSGHR